MTKEDIVSLIFILNSQMNACKKIKQDISNKVSGLVDKRQKIVDKYISEAALKAELEAKSSEDYKRLDEEINAYRSIWLETRDTIWQKFYQVEKLNKSMDDLVEQDQDVTLKD